MSSASYVAMSTPKSGLRNLSNPVYDGPRLEDMESKSIWEVLEAIALGPLRTVGALFSMTTLFAMLLVFLGCLVYGLVFIFAQANALTAGTDAFIRSFLLGLVGASLLYVTSSWTYWDDLPTIIYPAHSIALIGTTLTRHRNYSFGLVQALLYGVFQFGGFLAAGGILKGFGVTSGGAASTTLMNFAATNTNTYVMYWFGASVIAFSFVYNRLFKQEGETPLATANRTAAVTAIAIFCMTVAFFSLGLNSYSSAIYAAQAIVANGVWPTQFTGDTVISQAFFVAVDLLAVPATVWVAVIVFVMLLQGVDYLGSQPTGTYGDKGFDPNEPQYASAKATSPVGNNSSSTRLKQRSTNSTVHVNY